MRQFKNSPLDSKSSLCNCTEATNAYIARKKSADLCWSVCQMSLPRRAAAAPNVEHLASSQSSTKTNLTITIITEKLSCLGDFRECDRLRRCRPSPRPVSASTLRLEYCCVYVCGYMKCNSFNSMGFLVSRSIRC